MIEETPEEYARWVDKMVRKPDKDLVLISKKNLRKIHDRNIELQNLVNEYEAKYCR